jgi:two-component system sensor histidine kinase UhpB
VSLHLRLVVNLASVLALSLVVAAGLAYIDAIRAVRIELVVALEGAAQSAAGLVADRPAEADPVPRLARDVFTFEGNRHVRVTLLDAAGMERAASRLAVPAVPPPDWFVRSIRPQLAARRVMAGTFTLVLQPDPVNEIGDVWVDFVDDAIGFGTFCALAVLLIQITVSRALRPLARLSAAFLRLADGGWDTRIVERGPAELVRLAHGFNGMAARLAAAEAGNRRLQDQLQTLQDEERAQIARDLHDEIGPCLFAANLAATTIRCGAERDGDATLAADARGLQDVIGHMQREVRVLLRQLRPSPAANLGLAEAIGSLAAFWRARNATPQIRVDVDVQTEPATATAAALYRCVQEGLANALRHGRPTVVEVSVRADADSLVARVADDGIGVAGDAAGDAAGGGLGLVGMHERMAALGGSVEAGPAAGRGWVVTARLPWRVAAAP